MIYHSFFIHYFILPSHLFLSLLINSCSISGARTAQGFGTSDLGVLKMFSLMHYKYNIPIWYFCFGNSQAQVEKRCFHMFLFYTFPTILEASLFLNSKGREIFLAESKYIHSRRNEARRWDGVPVFWITHTPRRCQTLNKRNLLFSNLFLGHFATSLCFMFIE